MSVNLLDRLENWVGQVASRVQALQTENAELKERIDQLQGELEKLRRESLTKSRDIENFKHERLELRSRVKRIRENIATLEAKESTL